MPNRQFIRSRKAWYDPFKQGVPEPEEFMLSFFFEDDSQFEEGLGGEIALRYHPAVSGWRLEAFDDSLKLVPHFADVLAALGAEGAKYDGDGLEQLLVASGVLDKTARTAPDHIKAHPGIKR